MKDFKGKNNPMYAKHHTDKAKEKIRISKIGKRMPPRSEEYRKKILKIHKGKILSEDTKRKMGEAKRGRPSPRRGVHLSEETRQKIKIANIGKRISEETKRKISESLKGKPTWNKGQKLGLRPNQSLQMKGSNNPNWKGGISF